jgi:hypothetical protein
VVGQIMKCGCSLLLVCRLRPSYQDSGARALMLKQDRTQEPHFCLLRAPLRDNRDTLLRKKDFLS